MIALILVSAVVLAVLTALALFLIRKPTPKPKPIEHPKQKLSKQEKKERALRYASQKASNEPVKRKPLGLVGEGMFLDEVSGIATDYEKGMALVVACLDWTVYVSKSTRMPKISIQDVDPDGSFPSGICLSSDGQIMAVCLHLLKSVALYRVILQIIYNLVIILARTR